jgi:hypothetical protein
MITITKRMRQQVLEDRAEIRRELGERGLRGYGGAGFQMIAPCPKCEAEGRKTNGGYTPRLTLMVNTLDEEAFIAWIRCHVHGVQPEPSDMRLAMDFPEEMPPVDSEWR